MVENFGLSQLISSAISHHQLQTSKDFKTRKLFYNYYFCYGFVLDQLKSFEEGALHVLFSLFVGLLREINPTMLLEEILW